MILEPALLAAAIAVNPLTAQTSGETPFVCNLQALSVMERVKHLRLTSRLAQALLKTTEISEGYSFEIDGRRFPLMDLATWTDFERRCCPFFDFALELRRENGPVYLRLTGREGVKQFIRAEFSSQPSEAVATGTARDRNVRVMLDLFQAIEERDPHRGNVERELSLYQPDVEFHWPAALPYGGTFHGLARTGGPDWSTTWTPLQPTRAERRMDPQVIGASDRQVVILYHQRGVSPKGERFDGEVIGVYDMRGFKLARAQMFYFDEAACARFLERAAAELQNMKR